MGGQSFPVSRLPSGRISWPKSRIDCTTFTVVRIQLMAKRKELRGPGRCVYCLEFTEVTSDHIIPESWYPESKPLGIELPQAPSCVGCNSGFGKLERALRQQLGFAIDPWIDGGEGIGDKSLRAIDPSQAKTDEDAVHRKLAQEQLRNRVRRVDKLPPMKSLLPNIGSIPRSDDGYLIDTIDAVGMGKAVRKWVRGFTYYFEKEYLAPREYVVQAKTIGSELNAELRGGL
jgi:hypothetical protein